MSEPQKRVFAVTMMKRDQNHTIVAQTENIEEARRIWDQLVAQWTKCVRESTPFIIDTNVVATAFDPGMIYEITIKSTELTSRFNPNNPYQNNMQQHGFTETFGKFSRAGTVGQDVLDNGFAY